MAAEVPVFMLALSVVVLQTIPPPQSATDAAPPQRSWTGCIQAGSNPSTYRLNLDPPAAATSSRAPSPEQGSQGDPFLQIISNAPTLDLTKFVGKHVRVTGRVLTDAEAEKEAARRPNRQEANETAAGTGGTPQQHQRYVRVQTVTAAPGECR